MRAARLYGTADLRVGDEPAPDAGAGEALVRVTAVGICGSDLHWYEDGAIGDAKLDRPLVPGHEGAGEIAAGPRRGERVAIDPAIPCETCRACRDGYRNLCYDIAFSGHGATDGMMREVMPWPERLLHPLPDAVSDAGGAMLEPLGVALWALDLGHVPFGGTVCVVGCGPIGLLLIQLLRAAGVSRVLAVEPLPHRREAAATWGADEVLAPSAASAAAVSPALAVSPTPAPANAPASSPTNPDFSSYGVDVAFELAGNDDGVRTAMEAVRPGGRVVLGGIPGSDTTTFRASLARRKGLTIAMVRRMNEVYPRAIDLAARGVVSLDPLASSRVPLDSAPEAFAAAQRRTALKVIVAPVRLPLMPYGRNAQQVASSRTALDAFRTVRLLDGVPVSCSASPASDDDRKSSISCTRSVAAASAGRSQPNSTKSL
ncbi:MAG: alcohol dehydrogenase catalytic domain-containing protein [Nocardiopsaceae bacterium]|nr:alcohol dehydrogenase catalytic domain-containing protein [Nocardiopsaceae bacterium]